MEISSEKYLGKQNKPWLTAKAGAYRTTAM